MHFTLQTMQTRPGRCLCAPAVLEDQGSLLKLTLSIVADCSPLQQPYSISHNNQLSEIIWECIVAQIQTSCGLGIHSSVWLF